MMGFGYEGMGWWMLVSVVLFIVFIGAIIWLVVWAINKSTKHGTSTSGQNPLDIAKERYARGEITRDQFDQIKKDLA
jgi:putative membrane protein